MAVNSKHPLHLALSETWVTMRDLYKGEREIKSKGVTYLPATQNMRTDGMSPGNAGYEAYEAYKCRAVFHDDVKDGVEFYIGMMWQKPPTIEIPTAMEMLRDRATNYGESLELLLRRINEEQLVSGRIGLLLDWTLQGDKGVPFITTYIAESILNWDDSQLSNGLCELRFVALDESGYEIDADFEWQTVSKYRILKLFEENGKIEYRAGAFSEQGSGTPEYNETDMKAPAFMGKPFQKLPFVVANTKDLNSVPDEPPLMGLGRLSLAIYRGEADYRQNLFMQGQDTLVVIGSIQGKDATDDETTLRTGAGSYLEMEQGGDAKYIGVNSQGLAEQRQALEIDCKRAESRSGQLTNTNKGAVESANALQTRIGAQSATLNQIAMTGAAALERILKMCAEWMGANPEEVKVTPNLEFANFNMVGKDLVDFMTARTMGAPLSKESIHALLVDRGITKLDYETEMEFIGEEDANSPTGAGTTVGGNPNLDPNNPNPNDPSSGGAA